MELGRRLDFLLVGFGWCRMPDHLVKAPIADGKLDVLDIEDAGTQSEGLVIYAAHRRDTALGPAGRWLLDRLRQRIATG